MYNVVTFFFPFLGLHLWHTEVPRLGVKSELQLPAFATATEMPDPSHVCNLYHSSQQRQILNPLIKLWDRPYILMDLSHIHLRLAMVGTSVQPLRIKK